MRKIPLDRAQPGMTLAKNVYSPNGNILLVNGTELSQPYVDKMNSIGYSAVFIKEKYSEKLDMPEFISEQQRIEFLKKLSMVFGNAQRTRQIDTATVKGIVNTLTDEVVTNRRLMFEMPHISPFELYLFGHSINVCLLSLKVGIFLGYNELQLRDLGIGALLHDIGAIFIPKELLDKAGRETTEELEKVNNHLIDGFNMMREHKDINLLSCHVVYQHHERIDGKGFPRMLAGNEICEYARIVAIADMFDTLTNENMHRKSYPLHEAIFLMQREADKKLDRELLSLFLRNVAAFSTGTLVELNSGQVCLVTGNSLNNSFRPILQILTDTNKEILAVTKEIDLSTEPEHSIVKVLGGDEPIVSVIREKFDNCM